MIGSRFKKLILILLLALIIVGIFLFRFFQISKPSITNPAYLISSAMTSVLDIYDLDTTLPLLRLVNDQSITDNKGFIKVFSDFISAKPEFGESPICITLGLYDLLSFEQGIISLKDTELSKTWIESYLRGFSQTEVPPKIHLYKDYNINIYPIKGGVFNAILSIDGTIVLSNSLCNIESVIDNLGASSNNLQKADYFKDHKNKLSAVAYIKENNGRWMNYGLSVNKGRYELLHPLKANEVTELHFTQGQAQDSMRIQVPPKETFTINHYTPKQVMFSYQQSLDTILSKNESEWNIAWEPLIQENLDKGLFAFRLQDSVVSSSLILQCPVSNNFTSKLELFKQQNKKLIRTLLREEGLYSHRGVLALPAPYWLNNLTQTSRDLRVVYMDLHKNNLFISWDYQHLSNYITQLKTDTKGTTSWLPDLAKLPKTANSFFAGNIEQMLLDSITNYSILSYFTPTQQNLLKPYVLTEEYLRTKNDLFLLITLSENKLNKAGTLNK